MIDIIEIKIIIIEIVNKIVINKTLANHKIIIKIGPGIYLFNSKIMEIIIKKIKLNKIKIHNRVKINTDKNKDKEIIKSQINMAKVININKILMG